MESKNKKIDLSTVVLNYDGTPVKEVTVHKGEIIKERIITIRDLIGSCLNQFGANENPTAEQKLQYYDLTKKIYAKNESGTDFVKEVEFVKIEIDIIIKRAEIMHYPLQLGILKEFFDK